MKKTYYGLLVLFLALPLAVIADVATDVGEQELLSIVVAPVDEDELLRSCGIVEEEYTHEYDALCDEITPTPPPRWQMYMARMVGFMHEKCHACKRQFKKWYHIAAESMRNVWHKCTQQCKNRTART